MQLNCFSIILLILCGVQYGADAQVSRKARTTLTQSISENRLVALRGNTRPEANAVNDRGPAADAFRMDHMFLQLRRPSEQQQELDKFVEELHDPASAKFSPMAQPKAVRRAIRVGAGGPGNGYTLAGVAWTDGELHLSEPGG